MPEWDAYVARDAERAGTLCHRESGFLQEIAQEVAMRNSQNVWIDGSLRDGAWFARVFDEVREKHPAYSIAIFYVYASEATVRARCAEYGAVDAKGAASHLRQGGAGTWVQHFSPVLSKQFDAAYRSAMAVAAARLGGPPPAFDFGHGCVM